MAEGESHTTDVLLSWSGSQSKAAASAFRDWLPKVLPGLRPWISSKDIYKGKMWFDELQEVLADATSCVIFVTSENVHSPWIYYETGAVATKREDVHVCPYLVGIGMGMIQDGPLGHWQATLATKDDTLALILSLNRALATPHDETLLEGNFESAWIEIEKELNKVLGNCQQTQAANVFKGSFNLRDVAPSIILGSAEDPLAGMTLSPEAREILTEAATRESPVSRNSTAFGRTVTIGTDRQVVTGQTEERVGLKYWEAIDDLVQGGLLEPVGSGNSLFRVTVKGYRVADALAKHTPKS